MKIIQTSVVNWIWKKAVATTAYTVNGIDYKREVFTSFVDQLVIVRLTASQPGKLTFPLPLTCPQKVDVTVSGKECLDFGRHN